jgi:hypothetical protein
MVDKPDRGILRFPEEKVDDAAARVTQELDRTSCGIR